MADSWENLDLAFAELEAECTQIIRGFTVRIWSGVLSKTPQWAGRMVASYNYSLNSPDFSDRSDQVPTMEHPDHRWPVSLMGRPLWPGHTNAIALANSANRGKDSGFRLGDTVYISNGVDHGEGPYSQDVEDEAIPLRSPGQMARRTFDWAGINYAEGMTQHMGQVYKNLHLGA